MMGEEVNECEIEPQDKLLLGFLAFHNHFLDVFDAQLVLFLHVELQHHQPFLIVSA